MVRKLREWFPGAKYHLMQRGIRHMAIFAYDDDYRVFLAILKSAAEKHSCTVHAYCLMTNHYHLLVGTSDVPIWLFMQRLSNKYARYYNRANGFGGHLFEARYKACLVKDDAYFLQSSRYIHLNPVKAKMVAHAEDYPWSSYRTYLGMRDDGITIKESTLNYFGKKNQVQYYRNFVDDVGHKYFVEEEYIRRSLGEDDLWLPW